MEQKQQDLRLFDLARRQLDLYPNLSIFAHKKDNDWKEIKTAEFIAEVDAIAKGLIELGVKPQEKVGLIADSSVEWHLMDFAIQQVGAVCVAMYPNITDTDYQYIFNDAEIKLCVVSNKGLYNRIINLQESLYTLKYVFCIAEINRRTWKNNLDRYIATTYGRG
jgi:long-chain acyl-CoA synthetase